MTNVFEITIYRKYFLKYNFNNNVYNIGKKIIINNIPSYKNDCLLIVDVEFTLGKL